jgi:hypothetical protein
VLRSIVQQGATQKHCSFKYTFNEKKYFSN